MNTSIEEISRWKEQSDKYDHLQQRYDAIAEDIKLLGEKLILISKEINPVLALKKTQSNKSYAKFEQMFEEIYNALRMNIYIDAVWLHKNYPDLSEKQVSYLMSHPSGIKKLQGVEKGKNTETGKAHFFMRKE